MLELSASQARVLGALIEKSRTTPDYYPMTLNALRSACNQSSNRDPVTAYTEDEVADAMRVLRDKDVARSVRTSGSRMMKHRHDIENALIIDIPTSSLLAVLLLRGPQTLGELRTRTERYHDFGDIDEVETTLRSMAADDPPLVVLLDRQPGQKEARWTQLLVAAGEAMPIAHAATPPAREPAAQSATALETRITALETRIANLEGQLGL